MCSRIMANTRSSEAPANLQDFAIYIKNLKIARHLVSVLPPLGSAAHASSLRSAFRAFAATSCSSAFVAVDKMR